MNSGFWKGKTVFLTGHTGFKGAWMALWLTKMGAKVTGFSLEPATNPSLFGLARLDHEIESIFGDIRDLEALRTAYEKARPEIVFHMAAQALVRPSYRDPVSTYATNVMGTVHLFETVRQVPGTRVVVNVTSDKCYENKEWIYGYRENEAMGGYDPYSSSKGCSELVTAAYRRSFLQNIGFASGRAGNVIGGGDWAEDRLIPDCMRFLANDEPIAIRNPNSIRPWQHVLEPLSGYLLLAEKLWEDPQKYSEGFNFGPDPMAARPVSWIADRMVELWGPGAKWENIEAAETFHEAHFLKLDCTLARTKLRWEPRLSLSKTLEWVVDWYRRVSKGESAGALSLEQIENYEKLA